MRLERISSYEIRAYLSEEDIKELGIKDASRLDRGAAETILCIARSELDFAYENNNCEIYSRRHGDGYMLTLKASPECKSVLSEHESVLCFDDKAALKAACAYLIRPDILCSELRSEGNIYYLLIKYRCDEPALDGRPYWLSSVSELCFCVHNDKNAFFYYISEHSELVLEKNAVYDIANSDKKW